MKKAWKYMLVLCLMLSLCACGKKETVEEPKVPTWQEQYDLGVRYLSEGKYEEAIIAFTAAIEIDPKRADAYLGRGDAHEKMGDLEQAKADYLALLELGPNAEVEAKLNAWEEERLQKEAQQQKAWEEEQRQKELQQMLARLQEELLPQVADLVLPMTVDAVVLGETNIETAKATYSSYPYALSNLMEANGGTEDTVYTCFGMNDMPIPPGHEEMEFGFLFAASPGGPVQTIFVAQEGLTICGGLQINDSAETVLAHFGLPQIPVEVDSLQWTLNNGAELRYARYQEGYFDLVYRLGNQELLASVQGGTLYWISISITE